MIADSLDKFEAVGEVVNGTWIFLRTGAGKFPSLAGWRSAVRWISASVLWGSSTTLEGRWNWCS